MSFPEISRRCRSCGAAVRAGSRFCPQCGNALEAEAAPPQEKQEKVAPKTKDWASPTKEFTTFEPPSRAPAPVPTAEPLPVASSVAEAEPAVAATVADEEAARAGDLRERVARVREGTKARVGRMREEAIVVLEETPDDSGLRFILAAVALFAVFLLILFLSTTLLR